MDKGSLLLLLLTGKSYRNSLSWALTNHVLIKHSCICDFFCFIFSRNYHCNFALLVLLLKFWRSYIG